MGRKSKQKGKRGEREACDVLRPLFPDVRRKAMQARGGHEGADLENTPGYHVEVGVGAVNPATKWEQAHRDALAEHGTLGEVTPIALTRRDRGEWLVTMSAETWMQTIRHLNAVVDGMLLAEKRANSIRAYTDHVAARLAVAWARGDELEQLLLASDKPAEIVKAAESANAEAQGATVVVSEPKPRVITQAFVEKLRERGASEDLIQIAEEKAKP